MAFPEDIILGLIPYTQDKLYGGAAIYTYESSIAEPVSAADISAHFKLPSVTAEGSQLVRLCRAARQIIEKRYAIVCMDTGYAQLHNNVTRVIDLNVRPVLSIAEISYIKDLNDDTFHVISPTAYSTDASTVVSEVPAGNYVFSRSVWPAHRGFQSFLIKMRAGFAAKGAGDAAAIAAAQAAVPEDIKFSILSLAASMYEGREGQLQDFQFDPQVGKFGALPPAVVEAMEAYTDWSL